MDCGAFGSGTVPEPYELAFGSGTVPEPWDPRRQERREHCSKQRNLCHCSAAKITKLQCASLAVNLAEKMSGKEITPVSKLSFPDTENIYARKAAFEKSSGHKAQPFTVTYAFELKLDNYGSECLSLHFFMVKANCDSFVDGILYDSVTMAIDYDTGAVYDRYSVDESWMEKSEKEQAIYIAAEGGCFPDNYYSGEPIFVDSEIHIPLSDSDIAEVNQALNK